MSFTPIDTPPPAPSRAEPATFSDRNNAFVAYIVTFVTQLNALVTWLNNRIQEAFDAGLEDAEQNALSASADADRAAVEKGLARDERILAEAARAGTETAEQSAQASAAIAASYTDNTTVRTNTNVFTEDAHFGNGVHAHMVGPVSVPDHITVSVDDTTTVAVL